MTAAALSAAIAPVAQAAQLVYSGQVYLDTPTTPPVSNARVAVTFYGHENGIQEYQVNRTVRGMTDSQGRFTVRMKLSEYRYRWTHTLIEVDETEVSKEMAVVGTCENDNEGGCVGAKQFEVTPLAEVLRQALEEIAKL
ncbi:hypothetical protein C7271_09435 [filamentous cyanobacterium CCP5]|nr:hypothetical protein C7271_09435 [filamentous cyanobacterium CCP5]